MTQENLASFPLILIIIVTWNKKKYVLDLLASLKQQNYPRESLDILVVDNASNDGTVEAIKEQYGDELSLICNQENLGGTGGFNTGLKWAYERENYQYLWLLDNDVVVHFQALSELVSILEKSPDIAVAGSTMMQLDYPWRINEMGAYVDRNVGNLILHRHLESIPIWQANSIEDLLKINPDLTQYLINCNTYMDVDYVAAASLLIRADVAKQAGIWRDYFIHFDDVEWCLRIGKMGYRVVVSAKSLIWHLSAAAKVPTWVLYYDNRNILDLLQTHGANKQQLKQLTKYILKKAIYYHLIGKSDLAQLHYDAINDFQTGKFGKKDIKLEYTYTPNNQIKKIFLDQSIKRVLLVWTVDLQSAKIQELIIQAKLLRPELQIDSMPLLSGKIVPQLPNSHFIKAVPHFKLARWWYYWKLRGKYDLVIQSDYEPIIGLAWLKSQILFVNDEGFCKRPSPKLKLVFQAIMRWIF